MIKIVDNFLKLLKVKLKQRLYNKMIEEERVSELDDSIIQAKDAMHLLRESLLKIYGYNSDSTNHN